MKAISQNEICTGRYGQFISLLYSNGGYIVPLPSSIYTFKRNHNEN